MIDLLSRLPHVRGAYHPAAGLAQHTWLGVGGPADVLYCPLDEDDLAAFLAGCQCPPPSLPPFLGSFARMKAFARMKSFGRMKSF